MAGILWENDGSGVDVGYHYDQATGAFTVCHSQDVSHIAANNTRRRLTEDNSARRRSGDLYQIAEIGNGTLMEWKVKYGVDVNNEDHWPAVMRLIHSREYREQVMVTEGNFVRRGEGQERKFFTGSLDSSSHPLSSNRSRKYGGIIASGSF